ncbi:hypothetical protein SEA_BEEGEE_46 [Gordonia phage BeeGee]|nr:hypothetical protein SEA_BEEGEE_46 [Gordonia phage BeeGee]
MDIIAQLEASLGEDEYARLRDRLATNDDDLIENLVVLRKTKLLTQDEVAERMNRSKTAVSNFERLGADPHLSTIRRYAAAVGALIETKVSDYDLVRHDLKPLSFDYRYAILDDGNEVATSPQDAWVGATVTAHR